MKCALGLFVVLAVVQCLKAKNYQIVADEAGFLEPCDKFDDLGNTDISKTLDFSNLEQVFGDDGEKVFLTGDIIVKADIPAGMPIKFSLEMLRWNRGAWVQTVFSIKRDDFCKSAFDPGELWYELLSKIPENQRVCPPDHNTIYSFRNASNNVILRNLPSSDIAGLYKVIVHFTVGDYTSCLAAKVNVYNV